MKANSSQDNLNAFLKEQFNALTLLYKGNLLTPYLMVFYSTIEVLGHITSLDFDGFVIDKAGKSNDYTYVKVEDMHKSLEEAVIQMQKDFNNKPLFWKNCSQYIDKFYSRIDLNNWHKFGT
jgi:hypothetical protein